MTTLEQAARQALKALEKTGIEGTGEMHDAAITALRQALDQPTIKDNLKVEQKPCDMGQMCLDCADRTLQAMKQPKQEPVAWISKQSLAEIKDFDATVYSRGGFDDAAPLYAEPPQRKPLTRDQALKIVAANPDAMTAIRMTEAAHDIKE